jgi:anti-anti-sigma factor
METTIPNLEFELHAVSKHKAEISINGELDAYTATLFREKLLDVLSKEWKEITLNCDNLVYLSSQGVNEILEFTDALKETGGKLTIKGARDLPEMVFRELNIESTLGYL